MPVVHSRAVNFCLCLLLLAAVPAQAAVRLTVEGVGGRLEQNVRAHVGSPPENGETAAAAYAQRAEQNARRALQALGYYNAQIEVVRETVAAANVVRVVITPGPRVRLRSVDIQLLGDARDDPEFIELLDQLPLREGAGLDHGRYEAARSVLDNLAVRRGYFDARYRTRRIEVDAVDNVADIRLHLDSGPRYALGEVAFPATRFTSGLLHRLVPFRPGTPYDAAHIARFNRNLLDSGYFQDVRLLPRVEEAIDGQIPIEVELSERDPNRVGVGAGVSTDTGPRLRLTWDRAWVNRHGHKFASDLELAQVRQGLSTRYIVPLDDPINDTLDFTFGFRLEDFGDGTDSERFTASVQRQQYRGGGWQRTFFYRWERDRFDLIDAAGEPTGERVDSQLYLPGTSWSRTRSRGGIDPHWGDRQLYSLETTHPLLGSDIALTRLRAGARYLRPFMGEHRILGRLDVGALFTEDFALTPPALRFRAGGDQSIRGYDYNELGPGHYLYVASLEYGYQLRERWRLALFVDAGDAPMTVDVSQARVGAGFGVHWISPVGPIRLDLAWGVSEDPMPIRLHFSLGAQL